MVVGLYCRSISFPNLNSSRSKPSYHVRSTSLPSERTHPSIPQLKTQISHLISWHQSKPIITRTQTTSFWLDDGLTKLKTLLDSVDRLLQIPLTQHSLTQTAVDNLLEHFLRFLDVYGIFQTFLLSFKQEISSAQVAIRRKDETKLIAYVKFHRKMTKEISKLLSTVDLPVTSLTIDVTDEISSVIRDVLDLTTSVSAAVFESMLNSLGSTKRRNYSWVGLGFTKKLKRDDQNDVVDGMECQFEQLLKMKKFGDEENLKMLKKMQEMEDCVGRLETASGKVLRSLISTRVSLLNILTYL